VKDDTRRERRRKLGATHAKIEHLYWPDLGHAYFVHVCNTLVELNGESVWYVARSFDTLRKARMFCKREFIEIVEELEGPL
jgi:hypothetical protein